MDYQTTLHEAVKKRLLEVEGPLVFGNGESRTRRLYYLRSLDDNLAVPMSGSVRAMYENGSGSELDWKMCSIRSSSAMTFNILGNGPVVITAGSHAGTYNLVYEYQLPTLRNNPHPANLDAYLESDAADVYCEMKMFEWLGSPHHALRPDYLKASLYLIPREEAEHFITLFRKLACIEVMGKGRNAERLSDGRYDSLQMAKHLLAIYGKVAGNAAYRPRKITLLNCVWEFTNPNVLGRYEAKYLAMRDEEHEGFAKFSELAVEYVAPLFDARGIALSVEYVTACDLIGSISYEKRHKAKLARYYI